MVTYKISHEAREEMVISTILPAKNYQLEFETKVYRYPRSRDIMLITTQKIFTDVRVVMTLLV